MLGRHLLQLKDVCLAIHSRSSLCYLRVNSLGSLSASLDRRFPPFPSSESSAVTMICSQSTMGLNASPSRHRRKHTSSFSFILANLQFQEYCLDGDIQLMLRSPIRNFLTSRREPCFLLPLPPSTVHRATYFEEGEKGGRQLFFASFLFSLVCRLPSIEIYSLPPLLTSSSLFPLFPPPPSMNANSSIDTLSISHSALLSPPYSLYLALSQGPCNVSGYAGKSFRSQQSHDEEMGYQFAPLFTG